MENEDECAQWLYKLFEEKDRIYDHFVRNDSFVGLGPPPFALKRNRSDLFISIFFFLLTGIPSVLWFVQFLLFSSLFSKGVFLLCAFVLYFVLQWMINMSVIDEKKTR